MYKFFIKKFFKYAKFTRSYLKLVKILISNLKPRPWFSQFWLKNGPKFIKPHSNYHYNFLNRVIASTRERK